jgi:uncharacterized protein (TIGR03437 family)
LTVNYSTRYFAAPGYPAGSLMPDVPVKMYSADYFARHDPFLAAVLAGSTARPAPAASPLTLVNAAHFRADRAVAPGSLASLFGDFAGDEVLVNDEFAPLLAVTPGQINLRVPPGTVTGTASIRVRRGGAEIASGTATVEAIAPGLFVTDPREAPAGSVISIYATGQGTADPPPETRVYIGAERAEVVYSGAHSAYPGLWQINARIPIGATGQAPVFVVAGTNASNAITLKVSN